MQSVGLERKGAGVPSSYVYRKPLLKHALQPRERPGNCACGRTLHRHKQSSGHSRLSTVSAVAAVEAPVKSNARKRKQQVEPLLVVEDISKTHDGQRYLFEGVSFTVNRGDRLALVGPNGAGKSSLFKLLSGDLAVPALQLQTALSVCLILHTSPVVTLQVMISQTLES